MLIRHPELVVGLAYDVVTALGTSEPGQLLKVPLLEAVEEANATASAQGLLAGTTSLLSALLVAEPGVPRLLAPGAPDLAIRCVVHIVEEHRLPAEEGILSLASNGAESHWMKRLRKPNLARHEVLNILLPVAQWPGSGHVEAKTSPGTGLLAGLGCSFTGRDTVEGMWSRDLVNAIYERLRELGMAVDLPVSHQDGERDCDLTRNVDLFIAIANPPSTRLGHQIKRMNDLATPVLGVAQVGVPISCLYESADAGSIDVLRYEEIDDVPDFVTDWVGDHLSLLKAHSDFRVTRDAWHYPPFLELKEALHACLASEGWEARPSPLLSLARAKQVVSSIDAYSMASTSIINLLRVRLGLAPLSNYRTQPTSIDVSDSWYAT